MRVLYMGGSGYVGGLVVPLLRERFAVRVFDLRPPAGGGEYVHGDATDHATVLAALADADAVVHGAMAAGHGVGADAAAAFGVNVTSVHQALSAAHRAGVPHALYLSSLSVYADPVSRRLDESAVPDATDVYGLTKRLGEEVCRAAVARYGLSVNILRLAWPAPDHLWPAWGSVTPPARPAGPGGTLACATAASDVAAAIAAALSYREGLQTFTISAAELAGRWSTAKARDFLAWHPRFTSADAPASPPPHPPVNPACPQPTRPVPAIVPPVPPRTFFVTPGGYRRELARPPAADPFLPQQPPTGSDAGYRRALDQVLAASGLRAELLDRRSARAWSGTPGTCPSVTVSCPRLAASSGT